jgi:hypothetical protein
MTVEGVLGVEVFGAGNFSVFAELSTAYTFLSESLRGTEWKQQVYLGVTWFLWPGQRAARRATPLSTLDRATRRLIDRTSRHWDSRLEALDQQIERERTVPSE